MKTETQIRERLTECTGDIRNLENKIALGAVLSSEEEDDLCTLISERVTLKWVLL